MKLINIWVVYVNGDDRSRGYPGFFYSNVHAANAKARGNGWYGGDASVEQRKAVEIGDKHYLIDEEGEIDLDGDKEEMRNKLRKQAIDKLSLDELEALNIEV